MRFEIFIALRHLMSRERRALVSVLTAISVLGVVIGVAALVTVISVIDGAQEDYFQKLVDEFAHIEVWSASGDGLHEYQAVLEAVRSDPEVIAASPLLKRFALLKLDTGFSDLSSKRPAQVFGIVPELEAKVSKLGQGGEGFHGKVNPGENEIVLGAQLARQMGLFSKRTNAEGEEEVRWARGVRLYAVTGAVSNLATGIAVKQQPLDLVGVFESGMYQVDQNFAYTSLRTCQRMNVLGDVVDLVHARIENPDRAFEVKYRLQKVLDETPGLPPLFVRSWGELNPDFFRALALEKRMLFLIVMIVVVVAALNIAATLILITMEKTRQIGILRAMGCARRSIARIFILEGTLIGVVGTTLGVGVGLALCWILKYHFPIDIPEAYGLDGVPVLIRFDTMAWIVFCSIGVCILASLLPAFLAARLRIVEALRYE